MWPIFYSFCCLSLGLFSILYNVLPQNWAVLGHTAVEGIVLIHLPPYLSLLFRNSHAYFQLLVTETSGDEVCKDEQNLYGISLVKNIPRPDFHLATTTLKRRI